MTVIEHAAQAIYIKNTLAPAKREVCPVSVTQSIQSLAPDWQVPYIAMVDGQAVVRADWQHTLKPEQTLVFIDCTAVPQGGGKSNPLKMVLTIALAIAAPGIGAALAGNLAGVAAFGSVTFGQIATAIVGFAGNMLINAVLPAPKLPSNQLSSKATAASPTYSLNAQSNVARLGEAIPEHFGTLPFYPDLAAQPYAEYQDNEQYLYQLFCIGVGEYLVDEGSIKIADTPIGHFNEISYEIVTPGEQVTLFPTGVINSEEVAGQEVVQGVHVGPFVLNPAGTIANQLSIDYVCPKGLFYANDDGGLDPVTVQVQAQYQEIDDSGVAIGAWTMFEAGTHYGPWSDWQDDTPTTNVNLQIKPAPILASELPANTNTEEYRLGEPSQQSGQVLGLAGLANPESETRYYYSKRTRKSFTNLRQFEGASSTVQRFTQHYAVPPGRYQVRIIRLDTKQTDARYGHDIVWAGARAYLQQEQNFGDVTLLAMRMRATNNLSSSGSRKINLKATRKLPAWTGSDWSDPVANNSIALAYFYICRKLGLSNKQIDINNAITLEQDWVANGDEFNARFDGVISYEEALTQVLRAGRAKHFGQGGVRRIVRDQAQTLPVASYSERNIVQGSFSVEYLTPHSNIADAIDVYYFNADFQKEDVVRVALPSSSEQNVARLDIFGVTNRTQAYREGMYELMNTLYRRKLIRLSTEMEGFIPSPGDLCAIQHTMPGWGQHGEAQAWDSQGLVLTLTEPLEWFASNNMIALRKRDGGLVGPYVVNKGATDNEVVFGSAPAITPNVGDGERTLIQFGEGEAWRQPALLVSATPRDAHTVDLLFVNEDDRVHADDISNLPPAVSYSSLSQAETVRPFARDVIARPIRGDAKRWEISFTPSPWADSYVIQQSANGEHWTNVGTTMATPAVVSVAYGKNTQLRIAAIGFSQGDWVVASPDVTPPPDVENFYLENGALYFDRSIAVDLDGYEIRYQEEQKTDWDTAKRLHTGVLTSSPFKLQESPNQTITYLIKAKDTSGNYSTNASHVIVAGSISTENIVEAVVFGTPFGESPSPWSGVIVGGSVDGNGYITANYLGGPANSYDSILFYSGGGADVVHYDPTAAAIGRPLFLEISLDAGGTAPVPVNAYQLYYQYKDPNGEVNFGLPSDLSGLSYLRWPGSVTVKDGEYRFALMVNASSGYQTRVKYLKAFVDVPDKEVVLTGITTTANFRRLTEVAGQFVEIKNLQITLQGSSSARFVTVEGKDPVAGPLIATRGGDGLLTAATVDVVVQGY